MDRLVRDCDSRYEVHRHFSRVFHRVAVAGCTHGSRNGSHCRMPGIYSVVTMVFRVLPICTRTRVPCHQRPAVRCTLLDTFAVHWFTIVFHEPIFVSLPHTCAHQGPFYVKHLRVHNPPHCTEATCEFLDRMASQCTWMHPT